MNRTADSRTDHSTYLWHRRPACVFTVETAVPQTAVPRLVSQGCIAHILLAACALILGVATVAFAQTYDLSWHTIDGGGGFSAGGTFELEGGIGQHDAGIMTGGDFELAGGFWGGAVLQCACLGDMNSDGNRDGADISAFVACVIQGGACLCADVNGMNGVTLADVTVFVSDPLMGTACP